MAFNSAGTLLATADMHGAVTLGDPATGHRINTAMSALPGVNDVAFNPAGTLLATIAPHDPDGIARLWDPATGHQAGTPIGNRASDTLFDAAFDPLRTLLATVGATGVSLASTTWQTTPDPILCQEFALPPASTWSRCTTGVTEPDSC